MRKRTIPRLCGVSEAAEILGIKKQNIVNARKKAGFPEPIQTLSCGPIWLESDVIEYSHIQKKRKGDPHD
jgi:predicted DNA-binding transcriptional regulator AlpA